MEIDGPGKFASFIKSFIMATKKKAAKKVATKKNGNDTGEKTNSKKAAGVATQAWERGEAVKCAPNESK